MRKLTIKSYNHDWPSIFALDSYFSPSFFRSFFDYDAHTYARKSDDGKSYSLSFDVPGFKHDEISVKIENGVLTVSAENKARSYSQSVSLGRELDTSAPEAELKNGVLEVKLAHKVLPEPRKIPIKSSV